MLNIVIIDKRTGRKERKFKDEVKQIFITTTSLIVETEEQTQGFSIEHYSFTITNTGK